jgi:uncharacterized phage protein (TIGR02218 family)
MNKEDDLLIKCWSLELSNGLKIGFNDYDINIIIDEITYYSNCSEASAVSQNLDNNKELFEFKSIIDNKLITMPDILSGFYDNASIEIFLFNLSNGTKIWSKKGFIADIKINGSEIIASVEGLTSLFHDTLGNFYSENCRTNFGSSKCKFNTTSLEQNHKIISVENERIFYIEKNIKNCDFYQYGFISLTDKSIKSLRIPINSIYNNKIITAIPIPIILRTNDNVTLHPGCDKSFKMCSALYKNAHNFRGEPHIPTGTKILA